MEKTNVKIYFSVEDFTNTLRVEPTRALNKIVITTGTLFRLGTEWELGTGYEESFDINRQINFVLSQLEGKEDELNQLKKKYDLDYRFVTVTNVGNNEVPVMNLDSRFISFANSIGAEVEFAQHIYS